MLFILNKKVHTNTYLRSTSAQNVAGGERDQAQRKVELEEFRIV
jgi:hypothetical protein